MSKKKYAQFFTRPDVVELILSAVLTDKIQMVLDPGFGEGVFLERAHSRIQYLNPHTSTTSSDKIWGVDISPTLKSWTDRGFSPNIIETDFFSIHPKTVIREDDNLIIPQFDVIVANPPFTRQEKIDLSMGSNYKEIIIHQLVKELNHSIEISMRTSLYALFIYHSFIFLKENGVMGYITPNLWLSVDYGSQLQEFLLKNFKIKAIIGSKVERFFESADVDTIILIAKKCADEETRENNQVKFVQLRSTLTNIISKFSDDKAQEDVTESERWHANEVFWEYMEGIDDYFVDEEKKIRIFPVSQRELWKRGYNEDEKKYEGSGWDVFLRAPDVYIEILEQGKDLLIPLEVIGTFRRGFTTGANEFFYVPAPGKKLRNLCSRLDKNSMDLLLHDVNSNELLHRIEKEYWMHKKRGGWLPNYVMKSPKDSDFVRIRPEGLKHVVLLIRDDKKYLKPGALEYIEWGESQGFHERSTMKNRQRWYDLGEREPFQVLFPKRMGEKFYVYYNPEEIHCDQTLYEVAVESERAQIITLCFLNSTIGRLFFELGGYELTGSVTVAELSVLLAKKMLVINPDSVPEIKYQKLQGLFKKLCNTPISSIYDEVGVRNMEEVLLKKIKPMRKELDGVFFDVLNLGEQHQLEVYRAVVDLLNSREIKSKSV